MSIEAAGLLVAILGFVGELALGIGLWYVGSKASRIDSLEAKLEAKAGELIDAKIEVLTAKLESPVKALNGVIEQMQERLASGEDHFAMTDEARHKLELKSAERMEQLKTWATGEFATKSSLRQAFEQLTKIQVSLAACQGACKLVGHGSKG